MKRRYIEGVEVREEIKVRNIKSIKQNQTSSSFSFSRKAKTGQSFVLSFKLYYYLFPYLKKSGSVLKEPHMD